MIKVGLNASTLDTPELFRLLKKHPDVDIRWLQVGNRQPLIHDISDEIGEIRLISWPDRPTAADYGDIDVYIGYHNEDIMCHVDENETPKVIYLARDMHNVEILGVCEFNRKAMVRDGRIVTMPSAVTLLGALALMPLAKNLMLNNPVVGTVFCPNGEKTSREAIHIDNASPVKSEPRVLREEVLAKLQTSFSAPIELNEVTTKYTSIAWGIFNVDVKLEAAQAIDLFKEFYGDHRHVVVTDDSVSDRMVRGTNKAVIAIRNDRGGKLVISVIFDNRIKGSAGNAVHALNLLFGLDERIGL